MTLASIAQTESRFQPLTINDNTVQEMAAPATLPIAAELATRLIAAGHSVDLGIMQINSANLARLGLTPALAFDPCRSIAAAAQLLTNDYAGGDTHARQQAALRDALSRYNTGDPERGYGNGYVHKVELAARTVVPAIDSAADGSPPAGKAAPASVSVAAPTTIDAETSVSWNVWANTDDSGSVGAKTIFAPTPDTPGSAVFSTKPGSTSN